LKQAFSAGAMRPVQRSHGPRITADRATGGSGKSRASLLRGRVRMDCIMRAALTAYSRTLRGGSVLWMRKRHHDRLMQ